MHTYTHTHTPSARSPSRRTSPLAFRLSRLPAGEGRPFTEEGTRRREAVDDAGLRPPSFLRDASITGGVGCAINATPDDAAAADADAVVVVAVSPVTPTTSL